jgi:hypothetical protein
MPRIPTRPNLDVAVNTQIGAGGVPDSNLVQETAHPGRGLVVFVPHSMQITSSTFKKELIRI